MHAAKHKKKLSAITIVINYVFLKQRARQCVRNTLFKYT